MVYKIPLFDLNFNEKEEHAVIDVLRSKWISTGPKTAAFEDKFAEMLKVKYAIALTNCTASLHIALKLSGVCPADEVLCPSLTFVATVNAIRYVDAIPVFTDVKSCDDLTIDPDDIQKNITSKTRAIMVMHYGGFGCDMDRIMQIAKGNNIRVIEDACHGPLAEYKGEKLGTIGDIGCFSFFSNKNISIGEGGMLVTNNREYADRSKLLRSHGMTTMSYERAKGHSTNYDVVDVGYNYRMDDIRAAIGIVQLDKIINDLKKRSEIRDWYIHNLSNIEGLIIPFKNYSWFSGNYIFPIILKNSTRKKRDEIRTHLKEAGIETSVHYPAVHRFSIYKEYYKKLPITEYITDNLITLPMYSKLTSKDVNYIGRVLNDTISSYY
jgi:dTDP-4-amino-4,6-dideoxygalactose transaminase